MKRNDILAGILKRIDTNKAIETLAPRLLPGLIASSTLAQQMGIRAEDVAGILNPPQADAGSKADLAIPPGGGWSLIREWDSIPSEDFYPVIRFIMFDPRFEGISEDFGNILYYAATLLKHEQNTIDHRAPASEPKRG